MANAEHVAKLRQGVPAWNAWRKENWDLVVDLAGADLARLDLNFISLSPAKMSGANLRGASLSGASLSGASLHEANLREAILTGADLHQANLIHAMLEDADLRDANLSNANLSRARLAGANLSSANLLEATLNGADLSRAWLPGADLRRADLESAKLERADLGGANLNDAYLNQANLLKANLGRAKLDAARLKKADLTEADLGEAHLDRANLSDARLNGATLYRAALALADFSRADLTGADLRAATLFRTKLEEATLTEALLWETQRSGWLIKGIVCERASWDRKGRESTSYAPGEFEKLYSEQTCIELFYPGGVSKFELNTLPALLHHLASLHEGSTIRLKSIEETGGGAKISISVGEADEETVEEVRSNAIQVHTAQLALRDNEILRLETEKKYLETFVSERLIKAMLTATTTQNVFNAPVYGSAFSSGNAHVEIQQTINDNSAILALLEKIMKQRADLHLDHAETGLLAAEVDAARAELEKSAPSPSMLARSLKFVQKMAGEAVTKAAGKLGEEALSADWPSLLHQLNQFVVHLK
jgi:uncharacterized protein YjbI with pentapeptide repeats